LPLRPFGSAGPDRLPERQRRDRGSRRRISSACTQDVEIFAVTIGAVKLKNFDQDEAVTFKDHWRIDDIRSTEESLHALFKKR